MRTILLFFLSIIIFISLFILVPITSIFFVLSNPTTYKSVLNDTNIYNEAYVFVEQSLQEQIGTQVQEYFKQQGNIDVDITPITLQFNPVIVNSFNDLLPVETVQFTIENNITNIFRYIKDQDKDVYIYLPKTTLLTQIEVKLPEIVNNLQATLINIPTCTAEQESMLFNSTAEIIIVNCIPGQIKDSFINNEQIFTVVNNLDQLIAYLKKENELLAGSDNMKLYDLMISFQDTENRQEENAKNVVDGFSNIKSAYLAFKFGLVVSWSIVTIFIISYILLIPGKLLRKLAKFSILVIIVSTLHLIIIELVKRLIIAKYLSAEYFIQNYDLTKLNGDLFTTGLNFGNALIDKLLNPIQLISFALIMVSVGIIVGYIVQTKVKKEPHSQPSPQRQA